MKKQFVMTLVSIFSLVSLTACGESVKSIDFLKKNENELTAVTMECMAKKTRGENISKDEQCMNASAAIDQKNAEKKQKRELNQKAVGEQREKEREAKLEKRKVHDNAVAIYVNDPEKLLSDLKVCYSEGNESDNCKFAESSLNEIMITGKSSDYSPAQKAAYKEASKLRMEHLRK